MLLAAAPQPAGRGRRMRKQPNRPLPPPVSPASQPASQPSQPFCATGNHKSAAPRSIELALRPPRGRSGSGRVPAAPHHGSETGTRNEFGSDFGSKTGTHAYGTVVRTFRFSSDFATKVTSPRHLFQCRFYDGPGSPAFGIHLPFLPLNG